MEQYSFQKGAFAQAPLSCFAPDNMPELAHLHRVKSRYYGCTRSLHAHADTVEMVLVERGESVFNINGVAYPVSAGDLAVYNSKIVHSEIFDQSIDINCYSCSIRGLHIKELRENALIPDRVTPVFSLGLSSSSYQQIKSLLDAMFLQLGSPSHFTKRICSHLVQSLILSIMPLTQQALSGADAWQSENSKLCAQIKDYIDLHFEQDITLQSIAQAINISLYHMSHVFKAQYGFSPLQYIILRRIGEAQTLLEKTDASATQIGMRVGFGNPSYFNTIFTKKVGMSPLKYRKIYTFSKNDEAE